MAAGRVLILEGYDEMPTKKWKKVRWDLADKPLRRKGNKNSPMARAAKACRRLAKGKGITAPAYRNCVVKTIKKLTRRSR